MKGILEAVVEAINNLADAIRDKNNPSPWIETETRAVSYMPFGKTLFRELKEKGYIPYHTMMEQGTSKDFFNKDELDDWLANTEKKGGKY